MEDKLKLYVGEYSPEQGSYNICTVEEMLTYNHNHMKNKTFNGYIPLYFGGSQEEVARALDTIEEIYGRPGTWQEEQVKSNDETIE